MRARAGFLLLALSVPAAWPVVALPLSPSTPPAWLVYRVERPDDVGLYFRALTMSKWHVDGEEAYSPDYRSDRRRISSSLSYLPGDWQFIGEAGATAPRAALRTMLPEHDAYVVRATAYCSGEDCARFERELFAMPAPRVSGDARVVAAWRAVVAEEPCDALRPQVRPRIRFPPEELRRRIDGVVTLAAYHNRCGDVRDAVVSTTSGNRNLDRAAVNGVLRWRLATPARGKAGWRTERVEFRLDDPANPTIYAIDVEPASKDAPGRAGVQPDAR